MGSVLLEESEELEDAYAWAVWLADAGVVPVLALELAEAATGAATS